MRKLLSQRIEIVEEFIQEYQPPEGCLDVPESLELAKRMNIKSATQMLKYLDYVHTNGGALAIIPFQAVSRAMRGVPERNVRAKPKRSSDSGRALPPIDVLPRIKCRSCNACPEFAQCQTYAGRTNQPLPCEGYWIEEIQGLEIPL